MIRMTLDSVILFALRLQSTNLCEMVLILLLLLLFGQPRIPRKVRPIEWAPMRLSSKGVTAGAGHKVLMEVGSYFTDCCLCMMDFEPAAQASHNLPTKPYYFYID